MEAKEILKKDVFEHDRIDQILANIMLICKELEDKSYEIEEYERKLIIAHFSQKKEIFTKIGQISYQEKDIIELLNYEINTLNEKWDQFLTKEFKPKNIPKKNNTRKKARIIIKDILKKENFLESIKHDINLIENHVKRIEYNVEKRIKKELRTIASIALDIHKELKSTYEEIEAEKKKYYQEKEKADMIRVLSLLQQILEKNVFVPLDDRVGYKAQFRK